MKRAFIFANGKMEIPPSILKRLQADDLVIAADGGTRHCRALDITPGVIIGDFDSLSDELLLTYERMGVITIRYPPHKDETDLELAMQYAVKEGVDVVYILGALGDRWDMTVSNIMLLAAPAFSGLKMSLLDGSQEFTLLRGETLVEVIGQPGDVLSLIPLDGDCHGITTQGLEYPLIGETLYFGSPRGVSNVFVQDIAKIKVNKGALLCIVDRVGN